MNTLEWNFHRGIWSSPSRYVDPAKPGDRRRRYWIIAVQGDGTFDVGESNTALLQSCGYAVLSNHVFHDRLEPLMAKIQLIEDDICSACD